MEFNCYEEFIRTRITELRLQKNISEHRMSLDLDKSGSYIRSITSGIAMPSVRELFRIIAYLGTTPAQFFAPLESKDTAYAKLCDRLQPMTDVELAKVNSFLDMIEK